MNLLGGLSEKKHFLLLKALYLSHRWVTIIAGLFPLWEFPEMLGETCEKRDSAHGGIEARGGSTARGDFPLHCVVLTLVFGRTGSQAVITTPRPFNYNFHGMVLSSLRNFPCADVRVQGDVLVTSRSRWQFCEACWILLGILSCLQPHSPSLLFTPRSFSSPLSWWNAVCAQVPLC